MMKRSKKSFLLFGSCLLIAGALGTGRDLLTDYQYHLLARSMTSDERDSCPAVFLVSPGSTRDCNLPSEYVGWLEVKGTRINLPVAQTTDNNWYLHHDLWGHPSMLGCAFLDYRCNVTGSALEIYGHHISGTQLMLSELGEAYKQKNFDTLGDCTWTDTTGHKTTLHPLCALHVDKGWQPAQSLPQLNQQELSNWLSFAMKQATARAPDAKNCISRAHRVVALVTCSSMWSNQTPRTIVIFVA